MEAASVALVYLMVLPLKLFFLAVRQISKPIAGRAKVVAQNSESFNKVIVGVGRWLHRMNIQLTRRSEGKEALTHITELNEKAAVERGANFFSEAVIYSIASATVMYEYSVQQVEQQNKARSEVAAEKRRRDEMRANEERQWEEFRNVNKRITLMQEELWAIRQREERRAEAEAEAAKPRPFLWWSR